MGKRFVCKLPWLLVFLISCKSDLLVTGSQAIVPRVNGIDRSAAKPGEEIRITGAHLTPDLKVTVGGTPTNFTFINANEGVFSLPASLPSGVFDVSFDYKNIRLSSMPIINSENLSNLPLTTADPETICSDVLYTNPDGIVLRGLRNCVLDLCTRDGQADCRANADFPASDKANRLLPENIKSGITVGGIVGTLVPASTYSDCASDGGIGCITTSRYKAMDTDPSVITTWDIRRGKQVGGLSGSLDFYKSMALTNVFDRAPAGPDVYDTIDDWGAFTIVPNMNPVGFPAYTNSNFIRDPLSDAGGINGNGLCDGTEDCVYWDRLTNLRFSTLGSATTWELAIASCEVLDYGGYTDWRLPTQKENLQAYINGFASISTVLGNDRLQNIPQWSATTISGGQAEAYIHSMFAGFAAQANKANSVAFHCIR